MTAHGQPPVLAEEPAGPVRARGGAILEEAAGPRSAPGVRPGIFRRAGWKFARLVESGPARVGLGIIGFWVAMALLAPVIAPYPPNANDYAALAKPTPSAAHWLGTDHLGRDLLSRILWGARTVLAIAPLTVVGASILGSLLGLYAGYYRGLVDLALSRIS